MKSLAINIHLSLTSLHLCHLVESRIIPFKDWAHNAHSVPFEQSKNAHSVPNPGVLVSSSYSSLGSHSVFPPRFVVPIPSAFPEFSDSSCKTRYYNMCHPASSRTSCELGILGKQEKMMIVQLLEDDRSE